MPARTAPVQGYDAAPAIALLKKHALLQYPYLCTFGKARLIIEKDVFCPVLTNVSPFLLKNVDFKPGEHVLDAFAGSGAFGVNAALYNAKVTAFDTSLRAINCTQQNAQLNGVSERIEARLGTLDETILPDETFELIIANPPLLDGTPSDELEATLFDEGLLATKDFISALPKLLSSNGRCYLVTSDVIERDGNYDVNKVCHRLGLEATTVARLHLGYESYGVHRIILSSNA
jgi:methylase of polypeptide subunit release factors